MNIVNARQMQDADAHAIEALKIPSIQLMENAAAQVVRIARMLHPLKASVAFVCGKGNNGGDGLAVARMLQQSGWTTRALLIGKSADLKADPAVNWKRAADAGVQCVENVNPAGLARHMSECELVIDALFGTGLNKPLEGIYAEVVAAINRSRREVGSIDVPSGLQSDNGSIPGPAVRATWTVALAALKYCHILDPAREFCGILHAVDIGIPVESSTQLIRRHDAAAAIPLRSADSHKGTFGHAVIIGGSSGKSGAAYMSGKAALRAGAGLVTVCSPSRVQLAIAAHGPEIMTFSAGGDEDHFSPEAVRSLLDFLEGKTALGVGPGMGATRQTAAFLKQLLTGTSIPTVLDADALNILAGDLSLLASRARETTILTPHPGEMARMLNTDTKSVQAARLESARALAARTGALVVLKGSRTVIAWPDGLARINPTGSPALASAGTGDMLTGAITGLLAQGVAPASAALTATYIHGYCGNLFEKRYPNQALNAMDLPSLWNRAVHDVCNRKELERDFLGFHFT